MTEESQQGAKFELHLEDTRGSLASCGSNANKDAGAMAGFALKHVVCG